MINFILRFYWTPEGTPLWRFHLPAFLISILVLVVFAVPGVLELGKLVLLFLSCLATQVGLSYFARKRLG